MKSLFKPFSATSAYGMFGYAGHCCDLSISSDNPDMAEECWRKGWMDVETQTFMGMVIDKCDKVAPKVAERLRALGPCVTEAEAVA